jgi:eukaryotic-like serine/threonine-protein kinase
MAATPETCPPSEVLEGIAVGGAATSAVRDHLTTCDTCQRELHRIREDNNFLRDFLISRGLTTHLPAGPAATIEVPGYEIIREIHRGGQGVVYQAVQQSTSRNVAIKVMKQGPFATLGDRARFDREIETLGKLDHPNIVAVHDAGVIAGLQYFVMNYVDGQPLDEAMPVARAAGPEGHSPGGAASQLPGNTVQGPVRDPQARLATILDTFIRVCDAVHAAHVRGIIHRDLKPSNIRVDPTGEPHILDFGLAKSLDAETDPAMTRTGQFVGSLPWASPEQVEGTSGRIDLRSDVYSLGAILYQLLTGVLPFDPGSNLREAVDNILYREPRPPSAIAAATRGLRVNDELDTIVLKCLAKDRERRYQTAGELARDLRRYLAGEAIEAKRDSAVYMLRKMLHRYRVHVSVVAAAVVLLTAFGVVMAVMYRRSAHLEHQAVQAAGALNELLAQSSIERGRMAGMLGNMEQAEELLWRELLVRREVGGGSPLQLNSPPGPPEAYWGLWELYRRYPCRLTVTPQPQSDRTATLADDGQSVWTVDAQGFVQSIDELGRQTDAYRLPLPQARRLPLIDAGGSLVVAFNGRGYSLWRRNCGDRSVLDLPAGAELACVNRDGRQLATLADGFAKVWDTDVANQAAEFHGMDSELVAVAVSNLGARFAARERLGGIQVWDVATRRRVACVPNSTPPRPSLHYLGELLFSPDGNRLADAWMESTGRIWDLSTDPPTAIELSERPGDYRVQSFSPDGRLLAVGDLGGAVRIFDADTGQCQSTFVAHRDRVRSLAFTGDGRRIWTCGGGNLRLWDAEANAGVRVVRIEGESLHAVDISPAGDWLLAGGGLGKLHRIDGATLSVSRLEFGNEAAVSCVAISADGRYTAAATYANATYLWDGQNPHGTPIRLAHPNRVSHVCFSPDSSRLATACDDLIVRVWRAADGGLERELHKADDRIPQVDFDATGHRIAAAVRSGALLVWNLDTDACETWAPGNRKALRSVRFSPDGRWLFVAGAECTIDVWDAERRERVATLVGHNQEIYCLDISTGGELIASGDTSGAIRLWHAGLRRPLAALEGHTGAVMAVHLSPDGRTLASASLDGTLRVWDLTYYARHIAGNVETQLRRVAAEQADSPEVAAWRRWVAETVGAGQAGR